MTGVGVIAGSGPLPLLVARGARKAGLRVVAAALEGWADPRLASEVDEIFWAGVGQLSKVADGFKARGVSEAAFAGGVGKLKAFASGLPDLAMLRAIARVRHLSDDALLRSIAQGFEELGIRIIPSARWLGETVVGAGVLTRRPLTSDEERDVEVGREVAEAIGRADVGQTVVVKAGQVIAVEAAEGTDACIRRAGDLAGPDIVVVKRCKPSQDERFDLPTVGAGTVETIAAVRGRVLAIEAGRTLVLETDRLVKLADEAGISVVAG